MSQLVKRPRFTVLAVFFMLMLVLVVGRWARASEVLIHHIPSKQMTGNLATDGWVGLARIVRSNVYFNLDAWNPRNRRWEPSILPMKALKKERLVWAGAETQLPDVVSDSVRRWDFPSSVPMEIRISGVARLIDAQHPGADGVCVTIQRESLSGDMTVLWGGESGGVVGAGDLLSHDLLLTAFPGDKFLFLVSARRNHRSDTTEWKLDLALSAAPITQHLASDAFGEVATSPHGSAWEFVGRQVDTGENFSLVFNAGGWWGMPDEFGEPWVRIYSDRQHPGRNWDSVRRWTYSGRRKVEARISGGVSLFTEDARGYDGVVMAVRKTNVVLGTDEVLWKRDLNGRPGSTFLLHSTVTSLSPGDQISFVVNAGEARNTRFDSLGWNPLIRLYRPIHVALSNTEESLRVGRRETVVTKAERDRKGVPAWPDGLIGVLRSGSETSFFSANSARMAHSGGTLKDPLRTVHDPEIEILGLPSDVEYAAGGPIFYLPDRNGAELTLLFYYAEIYPIGDIRLYHAKLGLAVRRPDGSFDNLGYIFEPEFVGPDQVALAGFGSFLVHTDPLDGVKYFYIYTKDTLGNGFAVNLTVARAPYEEVLSAAELGGTVEWFKYRVDSGGKGRFDQPGLGNFPSSSILPPRPVVRVASVSYNVFLDKYLMAATVHDEDFVFNGNINVFLYSSSDGVNWTKLQQIEDDGFESFYCTLIGTGEDPNVTGRDFYVYYTRSVIGGVDGFLRWQDADLVRRRLTVRRFPVGFTEK